MHSHKMFFIIDIVCLCQLILSSVLVRPMIWQMWIHYVIILRTYLHVRLLVFVRLWPSWWPVTCLENLCSRTLANGFGIIKKYVPGFVLNKDEVCLHWRSGWTFNSLNILVLINVASTNKLCFQSKDDKNSIITKCKVRRSCILLRTDINLQKCGHFRAEL